MCGPAPAVSLPGLVAFLTLEPSGRRQQIPSQLHPSAGRKIMLRRLNPAKSGTSAGNLDQSRCEWIRSLPGGHSSDRLEPPSKEAKGCG